MKKLNGVLVGAMLSAAALAAQDGARGHWSGSIDLPGQPMAVEIDLDKPAKDWVGSMNIPAQGAVGIPLEAVTVANGKLTFQIKGAPGSPTFAGTLSADGNGVSGEFTQAGNSFPFKLSRSGDPKVALIKKSPAVAKEFTGTWEGTLEAGQSLRVVLKVTNDEGGSSATLVSLDQGGAEFVATTIEQKDAKLTLTLKALGAEYRGDISKDGTEMNGAWTQGGNELPLKFKKADKR